jgi:hypothetical protein
MGQGATRARKSRRHRCKPTSKFAPQGRAAPGFNQRAHSPQAKPNKSKQKRLDLLGFIRPIRDFSMGYYDSK